ncbi:hypothetical protein FLAN108750_00195 [Flavobacterium antarcticum]|uniref:hypothetical protein n=1 Tax=Flavobacterium antarcticum TaxID=271155 RepID=UPI0003B664AD|nr:hypothetical protein [Flavobacterium antarcticum]
MIESHFRAAAQKYEGSYNVSHFNVAGNRGSINPISIYTFSTTYKGILINIKYEMGNHNLAEVVFEIQNPTLNVDFKIKTRDNFSRLFSSKKNPWKVTSKKNVFTNKIEEALRTSGLTKMADETTFEPTITGQTNDQMYLFSTTFYLGFENKEHSLDAIIHFHQKVIDIIL